MRELINSRWVDQMESADNSMKRLMKQTRAALTRAAKKNSTWNAPSLRFGMMGRMEMSKEVIALEEEIKLSYLNGC